MLSAEEIKTKIESAFSPHRCRANFGRFGHKIAFRVYKDEDDYAGIEFAPVDVSDLHSGGLDEHIKHWREELRERGYNPS
jgi:hypothetical protein